MRERGAEWQRGEGQRGRELAQMRLALTQQDILSHILHMSFPILSQNQHWSYSVENRPVLFRLTKLPVFHGCVVLCDPKSLQQIFFPRV